VVAEREKRQAGGAGEAVTVGGWWERSFPVQDLAGFARGLRERGLSPSTVTVAMSVIRDLLADASGRGTDPRGSSDARGGRTRHAPVSARAGRVLDAGTVLQVCRRSSPQGADGADRSDLSPSVRRRSR
jgi:hypothetical protein